MRRLILATLLVLLVPAAVARAESFYVNSTNAFGGTCATTEGNSTNCSLNAAITAAVNDPGPDFVEFDSSLPLPATIQLDTSLPILDGTSPTSIIGPGMDQLTVDANSWGGIQIQSDNSVISDFTITNTVGPAVFFNGVDNSGANRVSARSQWDAGDGINVGFYVRDSSSAFVNDSVASGSLNNGIHVRSSTATRITGNTIGLNAARNTAVPNAGSGVWIERSSTTQVGTVLSGDENVIAGNAGNGVVVTTEGNVGSTVTGIRNNLIGTIPGGTVDFGNGGAGVLVGGTGGSIDNTGLGGNTIAYNDSGGVQVGLSLAESTTTGVSFRGFAADFTGNELYGNGGLPIDFGGTGTVVANDALDADTGANNLQNYPEIDQATDQLVTGSLSSTPNTEFKIRFYTGPSCGSGDLGTTPAAEADTLTVTTDAQGEVSYSAPVLPAAGEAVTSIAISPTGDTSQFGSCKVVEAGPTTYTVDNTNDFGTGSLRWAIEQANASAAADTIEFDIPGVGPHVITPATLLPIVGPNPVDIRGTTEPDYLDGEPPVVQIDGSAINGAGLEITANGTTVEGLTFSDLSAGVVVDADNVTVQKSYVGTTADGQAAASNLTGIQVFGAGATIADNLISGNEINAVRVQGAAGVELVRNRIGTDRFGSAAIANGGGGGGPYAAVELIGAATAEIGGLTAADANVISGNAGHGVLLRAASTGNAVRNNRVGLEPFGVAQLPNGGDGVRIAGGNGNDDNVVNDNDIAGNTGTGIVVGESAAETSVGNALTTNRVYDNGGGTIDLGDDGPTANDAGDVDVGPNRLQNSAVISAVTPTSLTGTIDSPGAGYSIQGYTAASCAGQTLRNPSFSTDVSGGSFTTAIPVQEAGTALTFVVTSPTGDTSEPSNCVTVAGDGTFTVASAADTGTDCDATPDSCTLREAIGSANVRPGRDVIRFGVAFGPQTITLGSELPQIDGPTVLDGTTQSGWTPGGAPQITLTGPGAGLRAVAPLDVRAVRLSGFGVAAVFQAGSSGSRIVNSELVSNNGFGVTILNGASQVAITDTPMSGFTGAGPIDLDGDGRTENDPLDADGGGNDGQNFPKLSEATPSGVTVTLESNPSAGYFVQLYTGNTCGPDERGRTKIAEVPVGVTDSGVGTARASYNLPQGTFLSASATDLDGNISELGDCVQVGPEPVAPTPSPEPTASPSPTPTPIAPGTVGAAPVSGTVLIKVGGQFVPLKDGQVIPVGTEVNALAGKVAITNPASQRMVYYAGRFVVGSSGTVTSAKLTGAIGPCPKPRKTKSKKSKKAKKSSAVAAKKKKKKKRSLWGDGSGSFGTDGKYGSATVRGTLWYTEDSCNGTLVKVLRGVVEVRDKKTKKKFTVKAGKSKLIKAP